MWLSGLSVLERRSRRSRLAVPVSHVVSPIKFLRNLRSLCRHRRKQVTTDDEHLPTERLIVELPESQTCRICHANGSDETLVSACAGCRGSSSLVHLTCLKKWYSARRCWLDLQCPICKNGFEARIAIVLGNIGLTEIENAEGKNSPDAVVALHKLANAYGDVGNVEQKRELMERALGILEHVCGPNHPQVAMTLTGLGHAYIELGNVEKARDLLERALAIAERVLYPDDTCITVILAHLGNAYGKLGDAGKNLDYLDRALRTAERAHGPDHISVARALTDLGDAYGAQGDAGKKLDLLERALRIQKRTLGPDHPTVACTLSQLGKASADLGDAEKSRSYLERALSILERMGPNRPEIAVTLADLCMALGAEGKKRSLVERALNILKSNCGPNHPQVASISAMLEDYE